MESSGLSKEASGIIVYLMEELGDARLRSVQLKDYVKQALDMIDKSDKRDHFFEVAAHLINGIPDALFKLDKALDAAAMAASRMDYEEIKQDLKPEKAAELERVLEDVRLRYLKRRSTMNAKEAAAALDQFAEITKKAGRVPVQDVVHLIARLEQGEKVASVGTVADSFHLVAADLRSTSNPSRRELAATLREILADALTVDAVSPPGWEKTIEEMKKHPEIEEPFALGWWMSQEGYTPHHTAQGDATAGAGAEFKKVNPYISDAAVEKIDEMHEKHKDVVKDKSAASWIEKEDPKGHRWMMDAKGDTIDAAHIHEVQGPGVPLYTLKFILKDGTALKDRTSYKKLADAQKAALKWMKSDEQGASLVFQNFSKLASSADDSKSARFEKGVSADPTEHMSKEDAERWWEEHDKNKDNFKAAHWWERSASATVAEEAKQSRFEEGVPADPTENMSKEDEERWWEEHEKNKDKFKSASDAWKVAATNWVKAISDHVYGLPRMAGGAWDITKEKGDEFRAEFGDTLGFIHIKEYAGDPPMLSVMGKTKAGKSFKQQIPVDGKEAAKLTALVHKV